MLEGFLANFMGGQGASLAQRSSSESSTTQITPWNQGDIVISYGTGSARSGDRTAPAPITAITPEFTGGVGTGITGPGYAGGQGGAMGGINSNTLMIAGVILGAALLWKLSR